jgi:hypothetical protein
MKKPVGDAGSQGRPAQSDLTDVQVKLLSGLNHEAVDLIFARYSAARVLGLWSIWEHVGEQEVIWRPPGWPNETSPEHDRCLRSLTSLELKFDTEVLRDLRSGDLLAFGIRLPFKPSSRPEPIPQGLWYLMAFDMEKRTAEGGTWSFKEVRTISVRSMRPSDRHELDLALGSIARRLEAEAAGHDDEPLAAPKEAARSDRGNERDEPDYQSPLLKAIEKLSASISSQPISISVTQDTVDVRLVDVSPDLLQRAANPKNEQRDEGAAEANVAQQEHKGRPQRKTAAGRPTMKQTIFRLQLERWATSQTAKSCAEEARQIEKALKLQFPMAPQPGQPSVPQWDSIENMIRYRYRRLRKTRNAINYLMGIRPV